MALLSRLMRDQSGLAIAEYGLIAAVIGAALAVGSLALGSAVSTAIEDDCHISTRC